MIILLIYTIIYTLSFALSKADGPPSKGTVQHIVTAWVYTMIITSLLAIVYAGLTFIF